MVRCWWFWYHYKAIETLIQEICWADLYSKKFEIASEVIASSTVVLSSLARTTVTSFPSHYRTSKSCKNIILQKLKCQRRKNSKNRTDTVARIYCSLDIGMRDNSICQLIWNYIRYNSQFDCFRLKYPMPRLNW